MSDLFNMDNWNIVKGCSRTGIHDYQNIELENNLVKTVYLVRASQTSYLPLFFNYKLFSE